MIIKKSTTQPQKQDALNVRSEVFVVEQNVPLSIELDAYDDQAIHFVGYENITPIAASRLRFNSDAGKLERICVLKYFRNRSYGKQLIAFMESEILNQGFNKATLNSQTHAVPFYKQLGYKVYSDEFMDAGIPHVSMQKNFNI